MMSKETQSPTNGILDYLDIAIGRLSKSDSTGPGKRVRSWSATIFFFLALPSFVLVGSVAFRIVYSTVKAPVVKQELIDGASPSKKSSKLVKRLTGGIHVPKSGYLGWSETILAIVLFAAGLLFMIISNEQDLKRAKEIGTLLISIGEKRDVSDHAKSAIEGTLVEQLKKLSGADVDKTPPASDKKESKQGEKVIETSVETGIMPVGDIPP